MDEHAAGSLRAALSQHRVAVLAAMADSIVPADEFPGATEAGVLDYFAMQFGHELSRETGYYRCGLDAVDGEARVAYGRPLCQLDDDERRRLLQSIEAADLRTTWPVDPARFFADVVGHVMAGYYGDPGNGGNRNTVSWQMIGFEVTD